MFGCCCISREYGIAAAEGKGRGDFHPGGYENGRLPREAAAHSSVPERDAQSDAVLNFSTVTEMRLEIGWKTSFETFSQASLAFDASATSVSNDDLA